MESNAFTGIDSIGFSVAGTISLAAPLVVTDRVFINASGAPGYGGAPVVIVDGGGTTSVGFDFEAGSGASQLVALEVRGFGTAGVRLVAAGVVLNRNYIGPVSGGLANGVGVQVDATATASIIGQSGFGNVISGNSTGIAVGPANGVRIIDNRIGTNPAGTAPLPNGIAIDLLGSTFTTIGGDAATFNLISGNNLDAVVMEGTDQVVISGNRIGTDVTGTVAMPNNGVGITVGTAAQRTSIGTAALGNVISGNTGTGILILGTQTTVLSNLIGVDAAGNAPIANQWGIVEMGTNSVIGSATARNTISGNTAEGILVNAASATATIRGNFIGLNAGGSAAVPNDGNGISGDGTNTTIQDNVISGNAMNGIGAAFIDAMIIGNIIGLNPAGTAAIANGQSGIFLGAGSGTDIGAGNTISGNTGAGILLDLSVTNVSVSGSRIGTDAAETTAIPNVVGVDINGISNVTLDSNVISGNAEAGVDIRGAASGIVVTSNIVGRNRAADTAIPNVTTAIVVRDTASASIGAVGAGNVVASNQSFNGAVAIANDATALIRANSIFDNLNLGIDIESNFVTPNDPLDPDIGPNTRQNYPVLTSAVSSATGSYIGGTLNSTPATTFTIDFFDAGVPDPSGFGEGQTYLGSMNVTTDASGNAPFTFVGPPLAAGIVVTSTATATTGTSEFSGQATVAPLSTIQFSSATYTASEGDGTATITVTRSGDLTATSTVDYSTSIGGSGTLTFAPGVASQTFNVPITADTTDGADETVTLTLSAPTVAALGTPSTATLTITDDDAAPTILIGDVSQAEGNTGTTFDFPVTLSEASSFDVDIDYATADGTATAGADYTAATGTLTIVAGETTGTISIAVAGDTTVEADETFFVDLTGATNASVPDNQALGTILNDDAAAPDVPPIPTLAEWLLMALAMTLAGVAVTRLR